jgi:hypothetical protein
MWTRLNTYVLAQVHPIPMSDIGQRRCYRANIEVRYSFRTILHIFDRF